jgi:acyl-coenzyme A thioesterase PaaI-like protein
MKSNTGTIRGEGKVVTIGRRTAFTEARLTDYASKLYASTTSSFLITA